MMTSVTDITEPTMYRNELANAQERFTTVLQSLDTAVSVAVPGTKGDLLFTNDTYQRYFLVSINGHALLVENGRR